MSGGYVLAVEWRFRFRNEQGRRQSAVSPWSLPPQQVQKGGEQKWDAPLRPLFALPLPLL